MTYRGPKFSTVVADNSYRVEYQAYRGADKKVETFDDELKARAFSRMQWRAFVVDQNGNRHA